MKPATATAITTDSFETATSWTTGDDGRLRGDISPVWSQGRSVYGGIVGAGLVRAMGRDIPDDRMLRSVAVTFAGPVHEGPTECRTAMLREGRTASFVQGEVVQDGTVRATATGTYGIARRLSISGPGRPRPEAPGPEEFPEMPYFDGVMPSFTQRFDFRWTDGEYPYSGSKSDSLAGWFRFRQDTGAADGVGIMGLIDAWPSPAMGMLATPSPGSTITWNVDLHAIRPDCSIQDWWYYEATTEFVGDGYTSFEASLWAPDGQYVARSRQLVGVFERPRPG